MNERATRRPSPALVISILALVVAMAGTAFAATQLPKNSVGSKQIKKNAITAAKIKKNAITTAKVKKEAITSAKIKLSNLKTVPSANVANSLAPMEATHLVGAAGEPPFLGGSSNVPPGMGLTFQPVGFFKDHDGVVHLEGFAKAGAEGPLPGLVFQLPAGFRPASGVAQIFGVGGEPVLVFGSGTTFAGTNVDGMVYAAGGAALLSGITFRAAG